MCVMSMVYDHFSSKPDNFWTPPTYEEYQELKHKAAEYDRMMNQPDCAKPEIETFETRIKKIIEEYMKARKDLYPYDHQG